MESGGGGGECLYKKLSVLHSRTKKITKLNGEKKVLGEKKENPSSKKREQDGTANLCNICTL